MHIELNMPGHGGKQQEREWIMRVLHVGSCILLIIVIALLTSTGSVFAEDPETSAAPPFRPIRYDEDYSYLRNPAKRTDFWDPIKYRGQLTKRKK